MCVDYTDLNKACKKDPFGLPRIDQVVDSIAGCSLLSFLDCYSVHFVIQLCPLDSKAVQFISGVYNGVYTRNLGAMQKCMLTTW
jgi:hypothetical protein